MANEKIEQCNVFVLTCFLSRQQSISAYQANVHECRSAFIILNSLFISYADDVLSLSIRYNIYQLSRFQYCIPSSVLFPMNLLISTSIFRYAYLSIIALLTDVTSEKELLALKKLFPLSILLSRNVVSL